MAIKILHCADIHLDTVFSGLDSADDAEIRREDLRKTFSEVIKKTKNEKADMLIISGDLFDSENVSHNTVMSIAAQLSNLAPIPVYICAGNHDPKTPDSCYNTVNFGENVHVFDTKMECIEFPDYDIYGVSFSDVYAKENYLEGFKVKNQDKINIMVMHGDFTETEYNRITKTQMEESGIDYLALGHIHKHDIIKTKNCTAVYPGCPEGRGFDELGEKGIVLSTVSKEEICVKFVPMCRRAYHEITVDVTDLLTYDDIISEIKKSCGEIKSADAYKIILTGREEFEINKAVLKENIKVFALKLTKKTCAPIDAQAFKDEFSLRGLFINRALKLAESDDEEFAQNVLREGIDALKGTVN